ncbi:MAG: MFS transporter [Spirochaetales bacterium]|nr:MFS transporter [Spirochaetales bacterium]
MDHDRLAVRTKIGYGFGELGSVLFWSSLSFLFINYLTDEVGLSAGLAGIALMIGKIWDAVTDPAVGILSDRTKSRFGRRRPWMLYGALPLGIVYALIFRKPGFTAQGSLFAWASIMYILLCTAYTVVNIPYISLIPDLTKDYDERTNLNGYRSVFSILGTLIGAGAAVPLLGMFATRKEGYGAVGIIFGAVIVLSALIPVFSVREKPVADGPGDAKVFRSYAAVLKNGPFLRILVSFGLSTAGISVITAVLIYYFKYVFDNEGYLTGALLSLLLCSMICIPLAVLAGRKLGKKRTYMAGLCLLSLSLLLVFFLGHRVPVVGVYILLALGGCGLSTHYVLPWSMLPDAVEYDVMKTGIRREGVYFGLWTFISKIGTALAGLIVGMVLSFSGYVANAVQSASALLGIRTLVGPVTTLFFIASIFVVAGYPLDRKTYESLRVANDTSARS